MYILTEHTCFPRNAQMCGVGLEGLELLHKLSVNKFGIVA